MFFESVSVYTILIGISVVNAKLFLPVSNNDDFLQSFANSTSDTCKKDITLLIASLNNNTLWAYRSKFLQLHLTIYSLIHQNVT